MTQAHIDLQSQLDSQNISNISDPSTTPLCNKSPISSLSPIEPTSNEIEQMDTTHKSSDTDNNEISSQITNLLNNLHQHVHHQKRNTT